MISGARLRRLLGLSGILCLLAAGAAWAIGGSPALAGGLALGCALGAAPFISWAWIAARGFSTPGNRTLAVLLVLGKLAVYSTALYLLVTRDLVRPLGVIAGLTGVVAVMSVGALLAAGARPREAA